MNAVVVESVANANPGQIGFTLTEDSIIASLCRDACRDERLRDVAQEAEIAEAVEHAVRALWADSRVKNFIAVIALRDVRESVGGRHRPDAAISTMAIAARSRVGVRRDDDTLSLSDDGSID